MGDLFWAIMVSPRGANLFKISNAKMGQAPEILPCGQQGFIEPALSIPWLLITWRFREPGHQQPWYCHHYPEYSSITRVKHPSWPNCRMFIRISHVIISMTQDIVPPFPVLRPTCHYFAVKKRRWPSSPIGLVCKMAGDRQTPYCLKHI